MSKNKTLGEQLEELQEAAARLNEYEKVFDKACRTVFGISAKAIHKMIQNDEKDCSEFERKICSYYGLNSSAEREYFLNIMCVENSLNYFRKRLTESEPKHNT